MQIFRVQDSSYQIQRVNVENTIYQLQLVYNTRDASWYLDLFDINAVSILNSVKLQFGSFITNDLQLPQFEVGNLYVIKTDLREEPITRDNFGTNKLYQLAYITNAELVEATQFLAERAAYEAAIDAARNKPLRFKVQPDDSFITQDLYYLNVPQ
jgi:hypothetical protein